MDGGGADEGLAAGVAHLELEGFTGLVGRVIGEGNANEEGAAGAGEGSVAAGVDSPGLAAIAGVFDFGAIVSRGGGVTGEGQADELARGAIDREDGIRRAFVHRGAGDGDDAVIVLDGGGVDAAIGIEDGTVAIVLDGGDAHAGTIETQDLETEFFIGLVGRVIFDGDANEEGAVSANREGGVAVAEGILHVGVAVEVPVFAAIAGVFDRTDVIAIRGADVFAQVEVTNLLGLVHCRIAGWNGGLGVGVGVVVRAGTTLAF